MIRSILIDDEVHCLETLEMLLKEYCPEVDVIGKYPSAKSGKEAIEKMSPDVVFLDIEMPMMNGFELLEQLKEISFSVVFTTSYDQYAIKAIKFSALDYLLKPIGRKELITAVQKVKGYKFYPSPEHLRILLNKVQNKESGFSKIAVPTSDGFELISFEQIIRCEADDNYTHLFLKNKAKILACRTLKEIEEQLEPFTTFIRVHNSHLVNLNEVQKYVRGEGGYLIMSDGTTVNVSRSRKEALLKRLTG
jgi:two-component system, LytTR family, response regulator